MTTSSHQRGWKLLAPAAGVVLAFLAVGCTRNDSQPPAAAARHPAGSSPSVTAESATVGQTACRRREHSTVSKLEWPLMQAAWRVESGLAGRNNLSARGLDQRVGTLWQRLTTGCPKPSTQATAFAAQVRRRVDDHWEGRGLDAVLGSYSDWATLVGLPHMGDALLEDRAACHQLMPNVRASYAVWWEPTARGKDYWVQMIVQNDTDTRLHGDLEGSLWVTYPLPGTGPAPTLHLGERAAQWTWGGSSADFIGARPHARTTQFVGVGEFYKVHLGPQGTMFDVRPVIYFDGCSLPVHRDH